MKKFLTAALSLTFVAGACLGMTGCKPSMDKIENDLAEVLSATNVTIVTEEGNTYAKSAVTTESDVKSWSKSTSTMKIDYEGLKGHMVFTEEDYAVTVVDGKTVTVDEKEEEEVYLLAQSDRYFIVSKNYTEDEDGKQVIDSEEPWIVVNEYEDDVDYDGNKVTAKEAFQEDLADELPGYMVNSALSSVILYGDLFEWNKDAEQYELKIGATNITTLNRLKKKGGVVYGYIDTMEKEYMSYTYSAVGKTSISIPAEVTAAVSEYIEANPVEAE